MLNETAGFTIFYMGINLGAAVSPILCGYIGETYGYHMGFGLATIGMLIGLLIFIAPPAVNIATIGGGSLATSIALIVTAQPGPLQLINYFRSSGTVNHCGKSVACIALARGGLPQWVGREVRSDHSTTMTAFSYLPRHRPRDSVYGRFYQRRTAS